MTPGHNGRPTPAALECADGGTRFAILLGLQLSCLTRVHLQHHAHVNDPKRDPDHSFHRRAALGLSHPGFFYHEVFFFRHRPLATPGSCYGVGAGQGACFVAISCWRPLSTDFLPFHLQLLVCSSLMVGGSPFLPCSLITFPHRPFLSRSRLHNARSTPAA